MQLRLHRAPGSPDVYCSLDLQYDVAALGARLRVNTHRHGRIGQRGIRLCSVRVYGKHIPHCKGVVLRLPWDEGQEGIYMTLHVQRCAPTYGHSASPACVTRPAMRASAAAVLVFCTGASRANVERPISGASANSATDPLSGPASWASYSTQERRCLRASDFAGL